MNLKQKTITITAAVLTACLATGLAVHYAHADSDDKPTTQATSQPGAPPSTEAAAEKEKPTGTDIVKTAKLRDGDIAQTITAFGSVTTQPGAVAIFSVPYECRVSKIRIAAGEPVDNGAALIEVEPSPAARLALGEAQSNLEVADKDLQQVQQRFDMKLGTNSDLLQSQQAVKLAQLRLDSLKQQGGEQSHRTIATESAGLVARVDVQQGQVVPAGNPLIETIAKDQVEVRLGVDPTQVASLTNGQAVRLFPSSNNSADPIAGKIRLITQRVNPESRLVDIFVTPDSREQLLLEGFVRAEIVSQAKAALIAPHNAVLPDDEGMLLYTVKDAHAVKHVVVTGPHNDQEVAITADGLHPGDEVVVQGNLELEDGMALSIENTQEEPK